MRLSLFFSVVLCLGLLAPGCGSSVTQEDAEAHLEGIIPVKAGQRFQIKLPANPTGGYGWTYKTPLETEYIQEAKRTYNEVSAENVSSNVAGYETWVFTAQKEGESAIELVYTKLWRENEPPAKTYTAHVVIS